MSKPAKQAQQFARQLFKLSVVNGVVSGSLSFNPLNISSAALSATEKAL